MFFTTVERFSYSSSFIQSSFSPENSRSAFSSRSPAMVIFTFSSFTTNSLMALKEGSFAASVSSDAFSSSSPNLCIRTMSNAFISFPQAGSVAWWE